MKRRWSFFLCVLALIGISLQPASAVESKNQLTPLFVLSKECPEEVTYSIQRQAANLIRSKEETDLLPEDVYLGNPFSYTNEDNDMFLYPVFIENKIKYVIRVTPTEQGVYGTISSFLADELNSLIESRATTREYPASFYIEDKFLVKEIGSTKSNIFEFSSAEFEGDSETVGRAVTGELSQEMVVNDISFPIEIIDDQISVASLEYASEKYLQLEVTEHQESNSWCNAYCTAIIGRYHGATELTAEQVMRYFYGSNPSTSQTLSVNYAVEYARDVLDLRSTTYTSTYLSISTLKAQIGNEFIPVTLVMYRPASDTKHAVVLRGYNSTTWSIWNPWYETPVSDPYESFDIGGSYTARDGRVYQYNGVSNHGETIYNWKA